MNLAQLAEEAAERLGERRSLLFQDTWHTNLDTLRRARRLHSAFRERGVEKGRIAALCMINDPFVYPVFQGIFRTGGAAVPVMAQLTATELRYILADTQAHAVITDQANLDKVREAVTGLDHVAWVAVRAPDPATPLQSGEVDLAELLEAPEVTTLPEIQEDDLALLLYTSGTTGRPKGAMLSHRNLLASARDGAAANELDSLETPRVSVSAMPMAHIFGVGVMNSGYMVPERLADGYMVQMRWFDPEEMMRIVQEHRCNTFPAVPTMLAMILNHPKVKEYDLSSLEEIVVGAAPLPIELARAFSETFDCRVREIYGMTEGTGMATANRRSDRYRPGSAGRAYDHVELRIVDDDDQELEVGERGEIVLRGPSVMLGYLNRPEATAETLRGGWLHTGDVGYLDDDGFLYIVDRKKDMIIRGGENIYPAELEAVLYEHPGVAEAAVVGIPDPVYGEAVIGYVTCRGDELEEDELRSFMAERTTRFKVPSRIVVIDQLPKSGVGKILRRELRERAQREIEL